MSDRDRKRLREIHTFPALVKYLREDLGWPVEQGSFSDLDLDDLTFDWDPEELGIDAQQAAKIEYVKQLRPLENGEPRGVFFVKFDTKSLPVVVLRKLLATLVVKKRATAKAANRPLWGMQDLVFISSYGQSDERQLSFAYFQEPESNDELPALKVLGWDDKNTPLHLDKVHDLLQLHLTWPKTPKELPAWRARWSAAFQVGHGETVRTAKELAEQLAGLARGIRERAKQLLRLETEKGPLRSLMDAFKKALIHDLTGDQFADMYAQTIAYGLLSARITHPDPVRAETLPDLIPITNPFLKELMETFVLAGGKHRGKKKAHQIDFDELGINDVVGLLRRANMDAVLRNFGAGDRKEDPVTYFYEDFLNAYDQQERKRRGVYYTPRPVVSYIVRSIHELLETEFGIEDGLASTITWGEITKRHKDLRIPPDVSPDSPFLQILDPATGTATFLVEVIDVIFSTLKARWKKDGLSEGKQSDSWNAYVSKDLLPRLYGYELMMAPYAIAHLKVGLKLFETGYRFESDERARVYLTNALEPASDASHSQIDLLSAALANEVNAVNAIKRRQRLTVVMGNPPYSIQSANLNESARNLVEEYKSVDGERIRERNALQFEKNLQDDYIKFIRLAELCISATGSGIVGYISNDSFLDSRSFRGMRQHLIGSFPAVSILDLHGSQKKSELNEHGDRDESVFDIQQGVCIFLIRKVTDCTRVIERADILGKRSAKYEFLSAHSVKTTTWRALSPTSPFYLLDASEHGLAAEYLAWPSLRDIVVTFSSGMKTHKDRFAYAFTAKEMRDRLQEFVSSDVPGDLLRTEYGLKDTPLWSLAVAREKLRKEKGMPSVVTALYRPFDMRAIVYSDDIVRYTARPTMQHLDGRENVALLVSQQQITEGFAHAFVTRIPADWGSVSNKSRESTTAFPLFVRGGSSARRSRELFEDSGFQSNYTPIFLECVSSGFGERTAAPRQVFDYFYAVLYSPTYRSRYGGSLKSDFPRVPLPQQLELFRGVTRLGSELVSLHLMEAAKLNDFVTTYNGPGGPEIGRVAWSDNTVLLNAERSEQRQPVKRSDIGFKGVSEAVWNFHIGSYQVCEKWLKDRKGRKLSKDDIEHYQKIVVAISETIRIMKEIDEVIDKHGGWPGAFVVSAIDANAEVALAAEPPSPPYQNEV
ncbi:MAG: hypothetical protein E6K36_14220 [Gammaproteobacteria bacterium]|nr:MAG: hypothetical protein E6K36_14220 [Gammaproteobacteria bacterium]